MTKRMKLFMAILVAKTAFGAPRHILFNVINTSERARASFERARAFGGRARALVTHFERARASASIAITRLACVDFKTEKKRAEAAICLGMCFGIIISKFA